MMFCNRGVAQPGSAPGLGPGGRRFESCRPDATKKILIVVAVRIFCFILV